MWVRTTISKDANNLTLQDRIEPGKVGGLTAKTKVFEKIEFTFDAKLNWTAFIEAKISAKIDKSTKIGDWLIEGGCKLIGSATIGPNWLNIAKLWSPLLKRGWNFIRIVGPNMIKWWTSAGTATGLNVAVSTLGFSTVGIGVPLYMLFRFAQDQVRGNMLAAAGRYADGYSRYLSYYTLSTKEFSLDVFDYPIWTPPRKGVTPLQALKELSTSKKSIVVNLNNILKTAASQDQGTDTWHKVMNNAHLVGGAHASFTLKRFYDYLKTLYGETEAKKSGNCCKKELL